MGIRSDNANLDLIRAVAVLAVFVGHLVELHAGRHFELTWHVAQMGVLIFFVHTSLVLMLSLDRSPLRGGAQRLDFYVRRAFRIYPLAMICVTFGVLTSPAAAWTWPEYWSNLTLTMNLTYTRDLWGGLWTLPLEVQMYVVLPFLLVLGGAPIWVALAAWVGAVALGILQPIVPGMSRLTVLAYAPCFLGGVVAWRLARTYRPRFGGAWWPLAFLATWPVFLLASRDGHMYYRWGFCLALGLIIPWFQEIRWRWLVAPARTIAKYSYGIYLSHVAVIIAVLGADLAWWASAPLLIIGCVTAPVVMYHAIEAPMIQVGRRCADWLRRRYAVAADLGDPVPATAR